MADIVLVEGNNELNVQMVPIAPPFDPWVYDINGDGYIDKAEETKALQDYFAFIITRVQVDQVLALPAPPVAPPEECATKAEQIKAVQDYFDGIITKAQVDAILALPTCP